MSEEYKGISKKGDYTEEDLDCAIECILEAQSIISNPELMKLVKDRAKKKESQIQSLQELRKISDDMNAPKEDPKAVKSLSELKEKAS